LTRALGLVYIAHYGSCRQSVDQEDLMDGRAFREKDFAKSSFSPDAGSCVEVAMRNDVIAVRDSKQPRLGELHFTRREWEAFIEGVKAGEFDLLAGSHG
jgi:hypothetical protein